MYPHPPDPILESLYEEKPPPNPAVSAFKRTLWILFTLLIILSLITTLILPLLLSRQPPPRRDPENDIQASVFIYHGM